MEQIQNCGPPTFHQDVQVKSKHRKRCTVSCYQEVSNVNTKTDDTSVTMTGIRNMDNNSKNVDQQVNMPSMVASINSVLFPNLTTRDCSSTHTPNS